jgi:elongin-A
LKPFDHIEQNNIPIHLRNYIASKMPVKSLVELCTRTCIKNIHELTSVGDFLLYEHVAPILQRLDSPAQLRLIEINSPQLEGETGEIWQKFIHKEFPECREKNYVPRNPKSWWKVYERYKREQEIERAAAEAALRESLAGLQKKKNEHVSRIVNQRYLPSPPMTGRNLGVRRNFGRGKELPSSLSLNAGSRMKMTNGRSVMKRARREALEIANIRSSLITPTGTSSARSSQVKRAPQGMANERRVAAQPSFRTITHHARQLPPNARSVDGDSNSTKQKGTVIPPGNFISDSEDEQDANPLFDESETTTPYRSKPGLKSGHSLLKSSSSKFPKQNAISPTEPSPASRESQHPRINKRITGLLSNAYRAGHKKNYISPSSPPKTMTKIPSTTASSQQVSSLSRSETQPNSPPPRQTSQPAISSMPGTSQDVLPRKRKAVDIFMRPKRRA